mgnify:CR=1 FL=1
MADRLRKGAERLQELRARARRLLGGLRSRLQRLAALLTRRRVALALGGSLLLILLLVLALRAPLPKVPVEREFATDTTPSPLLEEGPVYHAEAAAPQVDEPSGEAQASIAPEVPPEPAPEPVPPPPEDQVVTQLVWPIEGGGRIRAYGYGYSATFDDYRLHEGVDIFVPVGTPVLAAHDGEVLRVESGGWYDLSVYIAEGALMTVYGNCGEVLVGEGDRVRAGQVIGYVGEPGWAEVGEEPHLHFETRVNGEAVDPASLFGH